MSIAVSVDKPANRCALFDYGFRPFFLLCGCYAGRVAMSTASC